MESIATPGTRLAALPPTKSPLRPAAFTALPLGALKPKGWLERQLRIQADGLTGHLDEFWPDVGPTSGWMGGNGESWERGPYFLDGLLPLAHLLEDESLLSKAKRFVEWGLASQRKSGQFGPKTNDDWWPRMIMLKCLAMHFEATGDSRVLPFMTRYFRYQFEALRKRPLTEWAKARGGENILVIQWLFNLTGDAFLLDLAKLVFEQTDPWWEVQGLFPGQLVPGFAHAPLSMLTHGVNNAMGLKTAALMFAQTYDQSLRNASKWAVHNLAKHHGQPTGMFATDEHLNGTSPTAGAELCAIDEYMFSLEELSRLEGDPAYGDRLEALAYNAFASTFTADMWAHQFDQQVNQVSVSIAKRKWANNFNDANLYGLEPNYGCCTANMHQGWPKFAKSLAMATRERGLALVGYAPCSATAVVGDGVELKLEVETDYPFDGTVSLRLGLPRPTVFPLVLRIPEWAEGASVTVQGQDPTPGRAGTYCRVARSWANGDRLVLRLPMAVRVVGGHKGLVSVYRGPLLFGLRIGERFRKVRGTEPHADWAVSPTTPWNYGLLIDSHDPAGSFSVEVGPVPERPFDGAAPAVTLKVKARRLPQWKLASNSAGPIDGAPKETSEPIEEVSLVPYGCTRLRVAAFPVATPEAAVGVSGMAKDETGQA